MIYVTGNLCGRLEIWKKLLGKISFKQSDELFILGDVIDCGPEPVKLLLDLMERPNVFTVLGRNEYMFLKCFKNIPADAQANTIAGFLSQDEASIFASWIKQGGRVTFEQFMQLEPDDREAILDYMDEFVPYDIINVKGKEYVLTYSGIRNFKAGISLEDYAVQDFVLNEPHMGDSYFDDKTLVFALSPEEGDGGKIIKGKNIISLNFPAESPEDDSTLACIRLDDMKEFYIE